MFYFYYDRTYILVIIGIVICMAASARVNRIFARFSTVRSRAGMTGKEAAEEILRRNGISDLCGQRGINAPAASETFHYYRRKKTGRMRQDTVWRNGFCPGKESE